MTLRLKLASSAALVALLQSTIAASALAQTAPVQTSPTALSPSGTDLAPAAGDKAENIVVTGSRLKHSDVTSESPVTVVTAADIQHSGSQTIEDVLQKLPAIGTGGIYATTNNGGEGASCVDLRNLGIARTLVLVNGRRFPQTTGSTFSCVDLDTIPVALVDRIDVLKDGASAIYGADAVAGVINIITKKNFSGTTVIANGGLATEGGDRTGEISVTTGGNFDKGNVTFSADYENREPIIQRDRAWANPVVTDNNHRSTRSTPANSLIPNAGVGSGIPLGGRAFDSPNYNYGPSHYNGSGLLGAGASLLGTGGSNSKAFSSRTDRFNWGDYTWLNTGLERWNLSSTANYEIAPNINFYATGFYSHKHTEQQLAPDPVTQAYPGNPTKTDLIVPAGNPYLTALFAGQGLPSEDVALYKRFGEIGSRHYYQDSDTFNITTGLKGDLAYGWDYDVFFNYGRSSKVEEETNITNFDRLEQEFGFQQTFDLAPYVAAGQLSSIGAGIVNDAGVYNPAVCVAQAGCSLANPFGKNGLTAAQAAYIRVNNNSQTRYTLRQWGGTVTNNDVFELPYGPIGVVLGAEQRSESGSFTPDSLVLSGATSNPPVNPTRGGFDVTEVYGELRIPILKDLFLAKDLHIDLSGRYFNYNTFGDGETWKISGNYSPTSDVRFRATIGTAFRQPTINDLYGGGTVSYESAADPCTTPANANALANCKKQGAVGVNNVNGQVPTEINLGNPKLQPETARTYTIGGVFTPSFIPRLSATADYYHTRIANSIGALDAATILNLCYNSANLTSPFCSQVLPRNGLQQLTLVNAPTINLGETRESGLDLGLNYSYILPQGMGTLSMSNDFELLFDYLQQNAANLPFIQFAGQNQIGLQAFPRRKDNFSLSLSHGPFNVGYRMRYISGLSLDYSNSQNQYNNPIVKNTPEVFYHDIYVSYDWRNISTTLGADNIGDRHPPLAPDGQSNTAVYVYDTVGRFVYLKTSFKF